MIRFDCPRRTVRAVVCTLVLVGTGTVFAFQERQKTSRFDPLVIEDPAGSLDIEATRLGSLALSEPTRARWEAFRTAHGQEWTIYLDRRSGAPLLVEGQGIPWPIDKNTTADSLAGSLRAFIAGNKTLLPADDSELAYNKKASGLLLDNVWQVMFDREVAGIPVIGERYVFTIGHGRLISFGTPRWGRIDASSIPDLDPIEARERLSSYMGLTAQDAMDVVEKPQLQFLSVRAAAQGGPTDGRYTGAIGYGYASALVWRLTVAVSGEQGTWVALVDAHTGELRAFFDDIDYAQVKGGVYPVTNDQNCPEGCEQPNYPMPFADIVSYSPTQTATSSGMFSCSPAGNLLTTKLQGHYFRVGGACGLLFESVTCDADLNMGTSAPDQCVVPAGTSAGNTHAARTSFYHLNRIAEHARGWLPHLSWLDTRVEVNVDPSFPGAPSNYVTTCNAFWDARGGGSLNFLRGGEGCRNSGEIAAVMYHEWGHALDDNDGGTKESPGESYADITSTLLTHQSCLGRGFTIPAPGSTGQCLGYGNTCLSCTGIRDMDWDKRTNHLPSTPAGFVSRNCGPGSGPCHKEIHCEGYLGGETIWDLVNRDLTAMGVDLPSAWQLVDKLWFLSRLGSAGPAWECAIPDSDGCFETSLFTRLRVLDDDDGNLANGTPHAAAIFAAFDRHGIACGLSGDPSNQNHSSCPTIGAGSLAAEIGNSTASLSWSSVANAVKYRVMRNEAGCDRGSTIIANVTGTTYTDAGLSNGLTQYYTVQAVGLNASCDGVLSNCAAATPQPFPAKVKLSAASFSCTGTINLTVIDGNIGGAMTSVSLVSSTEGTPETVALNQIAPGSDTYTGSITLTAAAPVHDGVLSAYHGDTISATYIDASDGGSGINIPRLATASADCVVPVISKVEATKITGETARVTWSTQEPATSAVHYGTSPPPASTSSNAATVLAHGVHVAGLTECTPYVYSVDSLDVAGNLATDSAAGSYYAFTTGKTTQTSYPSTDTPLGIPDNNVVGATSTITVTDARTVQDVNLTVNVTHTFVADLTLSLITPAGQSIVLSTQRGAAGDNYTNTTFDDEAANPIGGSAPFTGTFRPESPLDVAGGLDSAGAWKLNVTDRNGQDVGSITGWTLQLTYANGTCGPHAVVRPLGLIADTCVTGGSGALNGAWDAGEHMQFRISVVNDGTVPLTGVTATVTPLTPGVVMNRAVASFPVVPANTTGESLTPHVTAHLPTGLNCGDTVSFGVALRSDQGSWTGSVGQALGRRTNGTGRMLSEGFDLGIPASWTVLDGGSGGGAASKWTTNNPGVRTIAWPMVLPVATVDSDAAGPGAVQDESLLVPILNLSTATNAVLQFDEFFRWHSGGTAEVADVDVRSSLTGGAWTNVLRQQGNSSANPSHQTVDVSAQAAGATDAQIRFHYWNGGNEQYWQVDNVTLDTSAPGSCDMPVCTPPAPGGAKPVPDGTFGAAMRCTRANAAGSTVDVAWDVDLCASADNHILYGDLGNVASMTVTGAACDLGTAGIATWSGVPAGNLWFVVVGDDNTTTEASWGADGTGAQRGGTAPSGLCGSTTRDNSGVCP